MCRLCMCPVNVCLLTEYGYFFLLIESVFDLISKEDQEKLAAVRSGQPMLALRDQHRAKRKAEEEKKKKEEEEKKKKEEEEKKKKEEEEEKRKESEERRKSEEQNGSCVESGFSRVRQSLSEAQLPASSSSSSSSTPQAGSTLYKVGMSFQPFVSNPAKQARYEAYTEATKKGETCKLWWSPWCKV